MGYGKEERGLKPAPSDSRRPMVTRARRTRGLAASTVSTSSRTTISSRRWTFEGVDEQQGGSHVVVILVRMKGARRDQGSNTCGNPGTKSGSAGEGNRVGHVSSEAGAGPSDGTDAVATAAARYGCHPRYAKAPKIRACSIAA